MPRKNNKGRAPNGSGSVFHRTKHKDGKVYTNWEGRCTVDYDSATKTQRQRTVTGKTQKEVQQKLTGIIAQVNAGTYIEPSKQTLSDWLDTWVETYVAFSVKPYTVDSYRSVCKNHIKPSLGNIKLSALSPLHIQQFYVSFIKDKGLSAKTVKNIHGVLHRALEQAVKLEIIGKNPSNACDLPKVSQKEIEPMDDEQVKLFLQAIKSSKFSCLYQVTLFTGLRQGEVLGLTWDCVDFERNALYINKQLQKSKKVAGEYVLVSTKNGRARLLTVAPSVKELLKQHKESQNQMRIAAGTAWNNKWNLVFTNELGRYLVHVTVYKHFKKIVRENGMEHMRFHDLRHSYAVAAIEYGDNIKVLQSNLGHATAAFTLNIYGHATQRMREQSAEHMEAFFQNVTSD